MTRQTEFHLQGVKMQTGIRLAFVLAILPAAGCAGTEYRNPGSASTGDQFGAVINQPFADLNVSGVTIPPVLARAKADPFAIPADCIVIGQDIEALSQVLGPALSSSRKSAAPKNGAADTAWGAARSAVGGLIPFRGVVRWISGADRRDQLVQDAVLAGYVRRAWLEGMREGRSCPPSPVSPSH